MNCGYGHGSSVLEVLDCVERVSGVKLDRRTMPRRPGDAGALVSDNRRILSRLDWTPRYDNLDTIVEHAWLWERSLTERASRLTN